MIWYFKYNPQTFALVSGAVCADEQPENSTSVDPAGVLFPKFNVSKQSWESDPVKLAEYEEQQKKQEQSPDMQQQIADLTAKVLDLEMKGL